MEIDSKALLERLTKRYGGVTPQALESILCPVLIPIHSLDKAIIKVAGQSHFRGSFTIKIDADCEGLLSPGRTGKFVPKSYRDGGVWRELAKGRILKVDRTSGMAEGEVYTGAAGKKTELEKSFVNLTEHDFWEVDQYGASAKVLSGLVEYSFVHVLKQTGYCIRRMPEDMAKHIGGYAYYDFEMEKEGVIKKLEAKSLWGTNTKLGPLPEQQPTFDRPDQAGQCQCVRPPLRERLLNLRCPVRERLDDHRGFRPVFLPPVRLRNARVVRQAIHVRRSPRSITRWMPSGAG